MHCVCRNKFPWLVRLSYNLIAFLIDHNDGVLCKWRSSPRIIFLYLFSDWIIRNWRNKEVSAFCPTTNRDMAGVTFQSVCVCRFLPCNRVWSRQLPSSYYCNHTSQSILVPQRTTGFNYLGRKQDQYLVSPEWISTKVTLTAHTLDDCKATNRKARKDLFLFVLLRAVS